MDAVLVLAAIAFVVAGLIVGLCGYMERATDRQTLRFAQASAFFALAGALLLIAAVD